MRVCEAFFGETTRSHDIAAYDLVIRTTQLLRNRRDNDNNDSKNEKLESTKPHTYIDT